MDNKKTKNNSTKSHWKGLLNVFRNCVQNIKAIPWIVTGWDITIHNYCNNKLQTPKFIKCLNWQLNYCESTKITKICLPTCSAGWIYLVLDVIRWFVMKSQNSLLIFLFFIYWRSMTYYLMICSHWITNK